MPSSDTFTGVDVAAYPVSRRPRRCRVLENVRKKLESTQPAERPVRITKPARPLRKIEKLWRPGQVVAFRRKNGRYVLLLTECVLKHAYIGEIPHFVVLKWEGAKIPLPDRIQRLAVTDEVIGVYPNKKGTPIPWDRVERLDATHEPSGLVRALGGGVYCPSGMTDSDWNALDSHL